MIGNDPRPPAAPAPRPGLAARQREWSKRLLGWVLGWLVFETLTGLSLYLLPFSVANQWIVIVHTLAGVAFLVPALVYQIRHLWVHWSRPSSSIKVMGYLGSLATLAVLASGVVLTWQALLARRISYLWDQVHLFSTFALVAFVTPHVLVILFRDRALPGSALLATQRRTLARATAVMLGFAAVVAALWGAYRGEAWDNTFPADYSYSLGKDRPFAPSLARTESGGAYDSRSLSGSESCGTSGCHEDITAQWRVSAHRWAAMDPGFQRIQQEMARQNGPESTRYCGGCHDPISLFSGTKNLFTENLTALSGYQEGVSCLACHSVRRTDVAGNANYIVAQPTRYLFEHRRGAAARAARDFLIRAYPWRHVEDLSKRVFKTPEYCAACHKQFIDQEVNNVGWVQLQNQYDNWRKSRWNHPGDPRRTIECRECHMPLVASSDPAAGDPSDYNRSPSDGRVRSHRFLGANQFIPTLLKIPGAAEQVELTEKWLRGEIDVPEIADKWKQGPAVALELDLPEAAAPGAPVAVRAVITSNKVGHDFPTGPLDIIQSWIEVKVTDERGRLVFSTGEVNEKRFIAPGSFIFKAEPVDQYGNLIDRHNLWEMVGVRFRRSLFPGFSDVAEFSFRCPGVSGSATGSETAGSGYSFTAPAEGRLLRVSARLLYRKIDQYLLNFMFGEQAGLTAPITAVAHAEGVVRVEPERQAARRASRGVEEARRPAAGPRLGSLP